MCIELILFKGLKMDVTADNAALRAQAVSIAKNQHYVDIGFKYLTQFFALSVLFALLGIIASLIFNAAPALNKFGFGFLLPLSGTSLMVSLVV